MSPSSRLSPLRLVVALVGVIVGLCGLAIMAAWYLHARELIEPLACVETQQFNAALCFAFSGAALTLLAFDRRPLAVAAGALVGLVGAVTLLEYVSGRSLGVDLLFAPAGYDAGPTLGRMAFNAALGFALLGALLVVARAARGRWRWALVGLGGAILVALGGLAILGYVADLPAVAFWKGFAQMAIHTAIEFTLVGGALVVLALDEDQRAGMHAPVWHAVAVSLGAAVLMFGLWYALRVSEVTDDHDTHQLVAGQLATQLHMALDSHVRSMRRQALRWRMHVPSQAEWEADARMYIESSVVPPSLDWVDSSGVARWRVSNGDGDRADVERAARTAARYPGLEAVRHAGTPLFVGPAGLGPGHVGFYVVVPLEHGGVSDGMQVGAFDLSRFLARVPASVASEYAIVITEGAHTRISRGAPAPHRTPVTAAIDVGGMHWTLQLTHHRGPNLALSWVFAFLGIMLSVLLGHVMYQTGNAERRSRQLETILDSSPVGMLLVDTSGRIARVNETACALFGYDKDEPLGRAIETLVPPQFRSRHTALREGFLAPGSARSGANLEVVALRRDGTTFQVDVGISTVVLERQPFALAIVRDVTTRYEAQMALRRRTEELARSNRDLEQFAYVASHDLRAPLRAVSHLSEWLTQDLDPHMTEEQRGNGRLLRGRVQRMDRLLSDLLEYARVTHVHKESESVDTAELLDDVIAMLDWPATFTFRRQPGMPVFATNRTALRVVFANLIGNAVKHHDRAAGTVEVGWRDAGEFHEFTVTDDGPGIPERYQAKAFEMFQTLRPRDEVEGSGMGLALTKRLIESREGSIAVESPGPRGTTFRFTWPKRWKETPAS